MCIVEINFGGTRVSRRDTGLGMATLTNYTRPATLPVISYQDMIVHLRTSYIAPAEAPNTYKTVSLTRSWDTGSTIVYNSTGATPGNAQMIGRAVALWDDLIANHFKLFDPGQARPCPQPHVRLHQRGRYESGNGRSQGPRLRRCAADRTGSSKSLRNEGLPNPFSHDFSPGTSFSGGVLNNIQIDNFGFQAIVHELGHAIGLSHPGFYNDNAIDYAVGGLCLRRTICAARS